MNTLIAGLGILAAAMTSLSYIPQVQKAWPRGATEDLSLRMLLTLSAGLIAWILYGFFKGDWVIICANIVAASLSLTVTGLKVRDLKASRRN